MKYQKLLYFMQNVGKDPSALMFEDYLTGLNNRRFLLHHMKHNINWETLNETPVSLLMMDIDFFKRINEQYGHGVGDQALIHITGLIKEVAKNKGIPVLYAGDQFIILCPNCAKKDSLAMGAELVRKVNEHLFFSAEAGTAIPVTLSIGIATAPDDAGSGRDLIGQAANALNHAKEFGRNRHVDAGMVSRQALQYLESAGIVGRKRQFEQVGAVLKQFSEGQNPFLIIDGAPGMGKTSFLDTLQRNLEKSKASPVRVAGVHQESFRPYYLISYIIIELMNRREDKGTGILRALDENEIDRLAHIIPQIEDSEVPMPEDDPAHRDEIFKSFIHFFASLTGDAPLILLIDDLHYVDPASLHLMRVIMREKSIRLFVCATAAEEKETRPEAIPLELFRTAYGSELRIRQIRLTPLSGDDITKYMTITFPGIEVPPRLTRELLEISRGNPLFVMEILRRMINDRKIVQSDHQWKITRLERRYFPRSLEDIIQNKLDALDIESKRFLECAAAFGESISLSMLTGNYNEKSSRIHDFLNQGVSQGIVRSDFTDNDENIRFLSKRIREIIYDGIHTDQRKNLHEEIGAYHEKLYKQHLLPSASFLAYHFAHSPNTEKAKTYDQLQSELNRRVFNHKEIDKYVKEAAGDDAAGVEEIGDEAVSEETRGVVPIMLRSLIVAVRNIRLYPADSKSVTSAVDQLEQQINQILADVDRFSIIEEKGHLLINQEEIDTGNFKSIAEKIIGLWDQLQLKSLTFIRGVTAEELRKVLDRISRLEVKSMTPDFWQMAMRELGLSHVVPRQVKYTKVSGEASTPGDPAAVELPDEAEELYSLSEKPIDDKQLNQIQRVIASILGAHTKLKLYPDSGPVAKNAVQQVVFDLKQYLARRQALTISRVDNTLLINGVKVDTSRFETLAAGLHKFLRDARLYSITFLKTVTPKELIAFFPASTQPPDDALTSGYWQKFAQDRKITGILFNRRVYDVMDALPGSADNEAAEPAVGQKKGSVKEMDEKSLPERLRELFLTGQFKMAKTILDRLVTEYQKADAAGRKKQIALFKTIVHPKKWRPTAAYLKFYLSPVMAIFDLEKTPEHIRQIAVLLQESAVNFIVFGEYALASWVYGALQEKSGKDAVFTRFKLEAKVADVIAHDLRSDDAARQQEAYQLLSSMDQTAMPMLMDVIRQEENVRARRLAADLLAKNRVGAEDLMKKTLMNDPDPRARARILEVIDTVTTDLSSELAYVLSDTRESVRRAALLLAERLNSPPVIDLLIQFTRTEDTELAVSAINCLGRLKASAAVPELTRIIETSDVKERLIAACRALSQIGDSSGAAALNRILYPKRRLFFRPKYDTAVRIAAAYAVSQLPDSQSDALIKALSEDPDPRIREAVKNVKKS